MFGTCGTPDTPSGLAVSKDGKCGSTANSGQGATCLNSAFGNCCSAQGSCGNDISYCGISFYYCQSGYGKCSIEDASNPVPAAGSYPPVSGGANPLRLNCVTPGDFALSFDDGVATAFDPELLSVLSSNGVTATFFINGYNW